MSSNNTPNSFTLEITTAEIIGTRENQEDSVLIENASPNTPVRIAIADGLGGHSFGEIASEVAVQTSMQVLRSDNEEDASTFHDLFRSAFLAADAGIRQIPWQRSDGPHPASTLINAIVFPQGEVRLAGLGDSIAWGFSDGHVRELLRAQGQGNWVRNALGDDTGSPPGSAIEHATWQMKAGDRLLVSTDGIMTLSAPAIVNILNLEPTDPAGALMAAVVACDDERQDNCIIVVVSAREVAK